MHISKGRILLKATSSPIENNDIDRYLCVKLINPTTAGQATETVPSAIGCKSFLSPLSFEAVFLTNGAEEAHCVRLFPTADGHQLALVYGCKTGFCVKSSVRACVCPRGIGRDGPIAGLSTGGRREGGEEPRGVWSGPRPATCVSLSLSRPPLFSVVGPGADPHMSPRNKARSLPNCQNQQQQEEPRPVSRLSTLADELEPTSWWLSPGDHFPVAWRLW